MNSELAFASGGVIAPLMIKMSSQARVMRLRVDPRTGSVVLTVPRGVSRRKALAWAEGKRGWVEAVLAGVPAAVALEPGAIVPLHDQPHRIDWDERRPRTVQREPGRLIVGGPIGSLEPRLLRWLKEHARQLLAAETAELAAKAGVSCAGVGVGDPVSRWGSCSSSGAIRYSWRLILAPPDVLRATVAHEVAHRVHMNHGPDFHALVERLFEADPKPARLWLRREGARLQRFGRAL